MAKRYAVLLIIGTILSGLCKGQADGLVAYVPERPIEHTADDVSIGLLAGAVAGKVEAVVPEDADQVDLLNARGRVVRTYGIDEMHAMTLADLRPGTWTVRVHRNGTMSIRRFVVMERGAVLWSPSGPIKRR